MIDDVVLGERLLDEEGRGRVDALEERDRLECVRGVRVELERQFGEALAYRLGDLQIPARLDLHLHPLVAALELHRDLVEERINARLDADRDAAEDAVARAAEERRERHVRGLREHIPDRHLERRLRHAVILDPAEDARRVIGPAEVSREDPRDRDRVEQPPHGLRCLARVPRRLGRDALAPADDAAGLDARDDARLVRLA